ncbi:MAG: altronate dehydratase family protein [Comamonadaceae bacterium]|nr:altronate dehydratase family protein [Comamonadaceae bacterium]
MIRLHPRDNVVVARTDIAIGEPIPGENAVSRSQVPAGYKIAARPIARGEPILKYNVVVGFAAVDIAAGTLVHSHNIEFREFDRDYAHRQRIPAGRLRARGPAGDLRGHRPRRRPGGHAQLHRHRLDGELLGHRVHRDRRVRSRRERLAGVPERRRRGRAHATAPAAAWTIERRADGRAAADARRLCARTPTSPRVLIDRPGLRGATRSTRCSADAELQRRAAAAHLRPCRTPAARARRSRPASRRYARCCREADRVQRARPCRRATSRSACSAAAPTATPASPPTRRSARRSTCWCATAAPAILSETPEIYGAEHLLTRRAVSREVGEKLVERIRWWEDYTARQRRRDEQQPVARATRRAGSPPSSRSRSARSTKGGTDQPDGRLRVRRARDRRRASCSWTRRATTRCRPPGRSPAART